VDTLEVRGRFDNRAISGLRNYLRENRIDIIHTHDFKSDFYGLVSACSLGIKRISTAHGSTRDSLLKRLYLFFDEHIVYRCFDRVIAVSEDLRTQLSQKFIPPAKIALIQNGLDMDLMDRKGDGTEPELAFPAEPGTKVFAVIGRLYPDKGHALFLEAFSALAREHPDVICAIVGDGPEKESIQNRIEASGLVEKVFCCGVVKDIKRVYHSIDYLVIPSLTEGLPYVLLEAMASGIPVLATSVGDIPLLVQDGHTGYLIPAGDIDALVRRMKDLVTMPERARLMAEGEGNWWRIVTSQPGW
jgi:glycosyltransferase involved in cell wall biosynthesis